MVITPLSWGCGGGAVVQSAPQVVQLPSEAEQRRRPRAETMGLLEDGQRELLQTKSTKHHGISAPHTYAPTSITRLLTSQSLLCTFGG